MRFRQLRGTPPLQQLHQRFQRHATAALHQHPVRGQQVLVKGSRGMALETLVELL